MVADPLRPGDERRYHPGETNLRMADVVIINKVDSAEPGAVDAVRRSIEELNPNAAIVTARSDLTLVGSPIEGKRVVVVEDGPTLTHGGMAYGAGVVAARRFGAARLVDPRPAAVGSIRDVLERYPALEPLVPAMGYGAAQIEELEATLNAVDADLVLSATPIDLTRVLTLNKPITRVRYELAEVGRSTAARRHRADRPDDPRPGERRRLTNMSTVLPAAPPHAPPSDFLTLDELGPAGLRSLLDLTGRLKRNPDAFRNRLAGRRIGMLFDKPSTRTRVSFESAAWMLGMLPIVLRPDELQLGRGETIADTARALSLYLDGLTVRTFAQRSVEELAAAASIPVINALTNEHHPCQALADA